MIAGSVRCRLAACPVPPTGRWQFILINDGSKVLEARLVRVAYEWGGQGHSDRMDVRLEPLAPGAYQAIWEDNGDGVEGRMDFEVTFGLDGSVGTALFEFPILYKKTELPVVAGVGRPGWDLGFER